MTRPYGRAYRIVAPTDDVPLSSTEHPRRISIRRFVRLMLTARTLPGPTAQETLLTEPKEPAREIENATPLWRPLDSSFHDRRSRYRDSAATIEKTLAPIYARAVQQEAEGAARVAYIADTIAQFLSEPAVTREGDWELEMRLDPKVLLETTLVLHLSPFILNLRFCARDARAHELLCRHIGLLKRRLEVLMQRSGNYQGVEIEIGQ